MQSVTSCEISQTICLVYRNKLALDKQEHIYKPFFKNTYYVQTGQRCILRNSTATIRFLAV